MILKIPSNSKCLWCQKTNPRALPRWGAQNSCYLNHKGVSILEKWQLIVRSATFLLKIRDKGKYGQFLTCVGFDLTIFQLYSGVKVIHIQQKRCFEFWILTFSQARGMWSDPLLWHRAGQQPKLQVSSVITRINKGYTYSYSGPRNHSALHFQYRIQSITWDIQYFIIKQSLY